MGLKPRENALLAYEHKQPMYIPSIFTDISLFKPYAELERYGGLETGLDGFGVEWKYVPNIGAPMTTGKHQIQSITEWKNVKFPDLENVDWKKQAAEDKEMLAKRKLPVPDPGVFEGDEKLNIAMVINGPFERMHSLEGFENALVDLITEEEACADYFNAIAKWKCDFFHKIACYYEVDVINSHDDYGTAHRMFMSLETWRKLIKPNLAMMVEQCHRDGKIYQHHSCGYVEPLIEDFIEIGIDALDPWQGGSNPNMAELKKKYGDKITFCGGFDNQYVLEQPDVTDEEIAAEYRRTVNMLAPGGSYVCFPIIGFNIIKPFAAEHFRYGMKFYGSENNL